MDNQNTTQQALALSPQGHVYLDHGPQAQEYLPTPIAEKIATLFANNVFFGLLHLGIENFTIPLSPSFAFWQHYARLFVTEACKSYGLSEQESVTIIQVPSLQDRQELVDQAPFMKGAEYLNAGLLEEIWKSLSECLASELQQADQSLETYLHRYNPSWNQVGRICFHLAENKNNDEYPFAFLATYTSRISHNAKLQHMPLKNALQEHAGKKNNAALLKLLLPIQKATQESALVKTLFDNDDIFRPLLWTARQAHQFLQDIPTLEACGVMIRIPNWWNPKKPSRPQVSITIGNKESKILGLQSMIEFDLHFSLANNEKLTEQEWQELLSSTENFVKIKGQWVEVDQTKLQEVLSHWKKVQRDVKENGLSFAEGLRLLAGTPGHSSDTQADTEDIATWSHIHAGTWLNQALDALRNPKAAAENDTNSVLEKSLRATLRPYQKAGVQWLWLIYNLKLGGCLADDMGLGKTIQVLSLILLIKTLEQKKTATLLIVPASLLGNWQAELARFAPDIKFLIVHSSANDVHQITPEKLALFDLIITTYAVLNRVPLFTETTWNLVVLDEAQMIKNPDAKQTKSVKALKSNVRLALTGTPIENRLGDLWSLFDFTSPGLLGSRKAFIEYGKKPTFCAAIRTLVSPYILRRLKNDRSIIQDLPDKTEIRAFCGLGKQQAAIYQQTIDELKMILENVDSIQRRGLVLSYLLRLKQICNHPDQWLGHGIYDPEASGKFIRLREICEQIAVKQEKVLIFTQFREIIQPLSEFLAKIFGHEGLTLHGQTAIKQRPQLVQAFQQEQGPQFFILSLKAGGTGLNLTNASHVIHFDRWWNPAVENQATDRAYRIGQKKNVLVHKFVCKGTIEEKIDDLISSKKKLSQEILSDQNEIALTELSNEELIKMVSLDLHHVIE